jgi:hypothetical protein
MLFQPFSYCWSINISSYLYVYKVISCRGLFRHLNILPFYSQYMYSLLLLVAKNAFRFVINNEIYTINTWQSINLPLPSVNLTKCKKGVYYMGIEIFNHLPWDIRVLLYGVNKFKLLLRIFLRESLYSINEYFKWSDKWNQNFM